MLTKVLFLICFYATIANASVINTELDGMLKCAFNGYKCDSSKYMDYGCYCGKNSPQKGTPIDGIDVCCQLLSQAQKNLTCTGTKYRWECSSEDNDPVCASETYSIPHPFNEGCANLLCEYERSFAMCVTEFACPTKQTCRG